MKEDINLYCKYMSTDRCTHMLIPIYVHVQVCMSCVYMYCIMSTRKKLDIKDE